MNQGSDSHYLEPIILACPCSKETEIDNSDLALREAVGEDLLVEYGEV
jgi:hypothetical protein